MSSFTTTPVLVMHGLKQWEVFTPFTYYRDPILKPDGSVKKPEEYTTEERRYRTVEKIVVPKGFVTDLTTIPRWLWILFPPHDNYAKAAIVHDYMYENAIGSKEEADIIFDEMLGVLKIKPLKRKLLVWGVKTFGRGNYKK